MSALHPIADIRSDLQCNRMAREADWTGPLTPDLDELAAFDAMRAFLTDYWQIGGKGEEEIAVLLSGLQRGVWGDGRPGDAAMWSDWLKAVQAIRKSPGDAATDPLDQASG